MVVVPEVGGARSCGLSVLLPAQARYRRRGDDRRGTGEEVLPAQLFSHA
jgi:hypothetical protein